MSPRGLMLVNSLFRLGYGLGAARGRMDGDVAGGLALSAAGVLTASAALRAP